MRAWIYDTLTQETALHSDLGGEEEILTRVIPRRSQGTINVPKPFLMFGLGNDTNERMKDSTATGEDEVKAHRQFWQVWIHDEGESYVLIDKLVDQIKSLFEGGSSKDHDVTTTIWLETSQEFSNETYNTIFRYIRFQSIISKGGTTQ